MSGAKDNQHSFAGRTFLPTSQVGNVQHIEGECPLPEGKWFEVDWPRATLPNPVTAGREDGFFYQFEPGALLGATHLTCDVLLDGTVSCVFAIHLQEGEDGPDFYSHFGFLNQCQARLRLPLEAVEQNCWMYPREGAWLKVICGGDRVDLAKVDRMRFIICRKAAGLSRWAMTPLQAVGAEPQMLESPLLPEGVLLDELGQSTLSDWQGKTRDPAELVARLRQQDENVDQWRWPQSFSRFGGWRDRRFEATGFFRRHHDGRRWWLVDPEGHAFWSAGVDCVRPGIETNANSLAAALSWLPKVKDVGQLSDRRGPLMVDYLRANFVRAFGPHAWLEKWAKLSLGLLRSFGFNTVGNWSASQVASAAQFPYVHPLKWPAPDGPQAARVFRDFPDVFDPSFETEAAHYASQLKPMRDDAALIGYFLMNEPTWGFAAITPAEGMLHNCDGGATRQALASFCQSRYADNAALAAKWGQGVTFERLAHGRWREPASAAAREDLEAFSEVMVARLYGTLTAACRAVDPNHMNLGARYFRVPPEWAMKGMGCFDVFSVNGYRQQVDRALEAACQQMGCPAMIGEWHFGALDAGLPASGIGMVPTQADRGRAYRIYAEDAAAQPWCVGVHYFTLYDQSAMGRFDGENYNIGFVDICHRPYAPLAQAARTAHERLYEVADGQATPFDDAPDYLPPLFF